MNVTETNIIEDNRRIIPMKEITKDWLIISISIIIIGKSETPTRSVDTCQEKIFGYSHVGDIVMLVTYSW